MVGLSVTEAGRRTDGQTDGRTEILMSNIGLVYIVFGRCLSNWLDHKGGHGGRGSNKSEVFDKKKVQIDLQLFIHILCADSLNHHKSLNGIVRNIYYTILKFVNFQESQLHQEPSGIFFYHP